MIFDRLPFTKSGGSRVMTSRDIAALLSMGAESEAGIEVTPTRALQVASVQACVKVLAESAGQLPLALHRGHRGVHADPATTHTLWPLLTVAPNEWQTPLEWIEFLVACMALRGNAYCRLIRRTKRGAVIEIVPLHPDQVLLRWDTWIARREIVYQVTYLDGVQELLTPWEILHVKLFTADGLRGLSPIGFAANAIGLAAATEKHGSGLFARGAAPGGVLEYAKTLSPEKRLELVNNWREQHEGAKNSHRVGILQDGMTWKSIQMSSTDSQFLETRRYQRSEIAGIFRVPPHMIGDLERSTFSNIEQQSLDFVAGGLAPYLRRIEQRIALQLLLPDERGQYFAAFDDSPLLRGDMVAQGVADMHDIQNGVKSPNECRVRRGMNPYEGGDLHLVPTNMSMVERDALTPMAPAGKPPAPPPTP